MKNLAQFKKRLAECLRDGGLVDFHYKTTLTYSIGHPWRLQFPEGKTNERSEAGCTIARVQSGSFARLTLAGTESWLEFGKASDWEFPNDNTAICKGGSYEGGDHKVVQAITYTFL